MFKRMLPKKQPEDAKYQPHLAICLPEIVSLIISEIFSKQDRHSYSDVRNCLLVNRLWHDCAASILWRDIAFQDTKTDYAAFLKFAYCSAFKRSITYRPSPLLLLPSFLDGLFASHSEPNGPSYSRRPVPLGSDLSVLAFEQQDPLALLSSSSSSSSSSLVTAAKCQPLPPSSASHFVNYYRRVMRSLTLRKLKKESVNAPLVCIGHQATHLEKLDLYICDHLEDYAITPFVLHGRLTHLSLAGCHRITDEIVIRVAEHCPGLQHLDLRACGLISDRSISLVATRCTQLCHLNVGRVRDRERITSASIRLVALNTKVNVLGLAGCDIDDECMILLAKTRHRHLERVSVNNCQKLTNATLRAYAQYCPNLSVFEMRECHLINDWATVATLCRKRVLLTLCEEQERLCIAWANQHGSFFELRPTRRS